MEEIASLDGEERAFQEKWVKDLLDTANKQRTRLDPGQAQSESPGPNSGARHNPSAIQYFIDGCQDGTLLKHKLMCSEPTSLAVLMDKADKYATADSAMRVKVTTSDKAVPTSATPKPAGDNRGG
ncbi:endoglucanase 3 [Hordeum vulgare]|nr:endoglucanase 3 [Hordeum vulgare]